MELRENPDKHVVLLKTSIEPKDAFFEQLAATVRASEGKNAFVFVHGYNVTFADAARRTAQMSYDLGFDGAPVFYSWPSRGATLAYTRDEQSVEWTQAHLKTFLDDFFTRSEANHVYLIAHSMGSRALTRAVADLMRDKPEHRARLKEVILAAPDIDADVFKEVIAPAMVAAGRPITLYSSSGDKALAASKVVHKYRRAGDSKDGILVVPGIESIDASRVETDFLGHSYIGNTTSVLGDIFHLMRNNLRADQRSGIRRVEGPQGSYWEFKP